MLTTPKALELGIWGGATTASKNCKLGVVYCQQQTLKHFTWMLNLSVVCTCNFTSGPFAYYTFSSKKESFAMFKPPQPIPWLPPIWAAIFRSYPITIATWVMRVLFRI